MILGEPNFITCRPAIYKSPTATVMGIIDSTLENHMDSCSFIDYILCSSALQLIDSNRQMMKNSVRESVSNTTSSITATTETSPSL